jgi:hypothetical protein
MLTASIKRNVYIHIQTLQIVSFLQVSPPNFCTYLYSLIHATCPAHLILREDLFGLMENVELLRCEIR